jgi:hypothetical protein
MAVSVVLEDGGEKLQFLGEGIILFLVHSTHIYLPMKMEHTECSKTSAYKLQTPENYPKESILHTEHSESLQSRMRNLLG